MGFPRPGAGAAVGGAGGSRSRIDGGRRPVLLHRFLRGSGERGRRLQRLERDRRAHDPRRRRSVEHRCLSDLRRAPIQVRGGRAVGGGSGESGHRRRLRELAGEDRRGREGGGSQGHVQHRDVSQGVSGLPLHRAHAEPQDSGKQPRVEHGPAQLRHRSRLQHPGERGFERARPDQHQQPEPERADVGDEPPLRPGQPPPAERGHQPRRLRQRLGGRVGRSASSGRRHRDLPPLLGLQPAGGDGVASVRQVQRAPPLLGRLPGRWCR